MSFFEEFFFTKVFPLLFSPYKQRFWTRMSSIDDADDPDDVDEVVDTSVTTWTCDPQKT